MHKDDISLLHLSDIHFGDDKNPNFDLDCDIRNELERTLKETLADHVNVKGLLISGDIAYRASVDEYENASAWLKKIAKMIGIKPWDIWCVPGNHDVNLEILKSNPILNSLRDSLRQSNDGEIDNKFKELLYDDRAAVSLLEPFENYNSFAGEFGCQFTKEVPWIDGEIELNDGSSLKIRGINSSITSDLQDCPNNRKLVVSYFDVNLKRDSGVIWLTLCHHPLSWVKREKELGGYLSSRAVLQVYGHEHEHLVQKVDNTLMIRSGAVHPHRKEKEWNPRFNWLKLKVKNEPSRKLEVRAYPLKYAKERTRFEPDYHFCDGNTYKDYDLELESWTNPKAERSSGDTQQTKEPLVDVKEKVSPVVKYNNKEMAYKLLQIPLGKRYAIASCLELVQDEDDGTDSSVQIVNWIKRAEQEGKSEGLFNKIEEAYKKYDT